MWRVKRKRGKEEHKIRQESESAAAPLQDVCTNSRILMLILNATGKVDREQSVILHPRFSIFPPSISNLRSRLLVRLSSPV